MNNLIKKTNPFSDLVKKFESFDSLFNDDSLFDFSKTVNLAKKENNEEFDDRFVKTIDLSSFKKEDIKVTLIGNTIQVNCERKDENSHSQFSLKETVSNTVKLNDITSEFKDGKLIITLPKKEECIKKSTDVKEIEVK